MMPHYELIVYSLLISMVKGSTYDESNLQYLSVSRTSTLTASSDVYKHGGKSLKWTWQAGDTFTLDLYHEPIEKNQLRSGGIKVWFYLTRNIPGKITLSFYTSFFANLWGAYDDPECQFDISLEFSGWRAIWVGFDECRRRQSMFPLYRMELQAPRDRRGEIYIDLLRMIRKIQRQSRDEIVPPIQSRSSSAKHFWQQTHRWSRVKPKHDIFNELEMNDEQLEQLKDIRLIRTRLTDWYCNRGKATHDLTDYFRARWLHLKRRIRRARQYLGKLSITKTKGFIRGPPLFSRNSEYGKLHIHSPDLKFSFVFQKVLFPLSLEHFFLTRKEEIQRIVETELPKLNDPNLASETVQRLTGKDKELMDVFYESSELRVRTLTRRQLRIALRDVNHHRFLRILRLLEYIMDQGWAAGSGLGSLDHEMNRSSQGFVTSIFLLRKPLRRAGKLAHLISITKWYLEFGELYQDQFEYSGTTADRMRTLMLYRLMCVLVMPEATLQEALEKLRDMKALKNWYENALSVNTGLGGVIKPDYTSYHHKSFYPNDYVLPALVTASHVVLLLRGTKFQINEAGRRNLRNAINLLRILSVKYSIPNSVANADPTFAEPELICLIPALAYMTQWEDQSRDELSTSRRMSTQYRSRNWLSTTRKISTQYRLRSWLSTSRKVSTQYLSRNDVSTPHRMSTQSIETLRAFLRLFNESDVNVQAYLSYGKGCRWKTSYIHSLGSLRFMYDLKGRAKGLGTTAEQSPVGNWAKNFAALVIHRRDNWAVTVKGFNNFVWGHESSHRGNYYGLYQSYGQLLVANSDHALKAYDINRGWDWTRLPGTTTLRVPLQQLVYKQSRFYNPKDLCGAVSFQGTSRFGNGVFVMDFQRPDYGPSRAGHDDGQETRFWFKKSVFFYDELLVCLGSDINARRSTPIEAETTLFQNIGNISDTVHTVRVNGFEVPIETAEHSRQFIWEKSSVATLMDVNRNGYYIPKAGTQHLKVRIGKQSSYSGEILDASTEGHFATAWLKHGANPKGMTYEYAVLVNTSLAKLRKFACRQEKIRGTPKYQVLQKDTRAHVVKFNNSPRLGLATYGYSVFTKSAILPSSGPLWTVGDPCVVMVEDGGEKSRRLIVGLSYPQRNFNSTKKLRTSQDVDEEELFYMRSQEKRIWVLLKSKVDADNYRVYVDGRPVDSKDATRYVRIIPLFSGANSGSLVYFTNIFNGFTTEVHFRRIPNIHVEV